MLVFILFEIELSRVKFRKVNFCSRDFMFGNYAFLQRVATPSKPSKIIVLGVEGECQDNSRVGVPFKAAVLEASVGADRGTAVPRAATFIPRPSPPGATAVAKRGSHINIALS